MVARFAFLVPWATIAIACAAAPHGAMTPLPMPAATDARHDAMDAFGRRLHAALTAGRPTDVLFGDVELRQLCDGSAATRIAARRGGPSLRVGAQPAVAQGLAHTEYLGVCLQYARDDDDAVGLESPGWTFRRVLLAARLPGGRRTALWVDGLFVFTDSGFGALELERVEAPRWEHSDLELAPCDMATTLR